MSKVKISKTTNPIHFEDLEPHRFEDLVRQLLYDYKDWQNIEATGRGGSDDGFDIRAYEKINKEFVPSEDNLDAIEIPSPMDGNLWMIQCKREQTLGPSQIIKIINEGVSSDTPPYGYVLVASANFSKKSYDTFRNELQKKGVMEFFLWGKAELEDILYQPKYDRILFTFFGYSHLMTKRTRTTEIRSYIQTKNKIMKLLGDNPIFQKIFIRDLHDEHYPHESNYKDFDTIPRWKTYSVTNNSVNGLWVELQSYRAYFDPLKKEWDYAEALDLSFLENDEHLESEMSLYRKIIDFQETFPESNRNILSIWGFVSFKNMVLIDEKGDPLNSLPHLYVEMIDGKSFFSRTISIIGSGADEIQVDLPEFKRIKIFPEVFPAKTKGIFHKDKKIKVSSDVFKIINKEYFQTLFSKSNQYDYLQSGDSVLIENSSNSDENLVLQLNTKYSMISKDYIEVNTRHSKIREYIKAQIGDDLNNTHLFIYEFSRIPSYEVNEKIES